MKLRLAPASGRTHLPLLTPLILALLMAPVLCSALTVVVNDRTLPNEPPAVMIGGRTLLPMRLVFEALGAQVGWEGATQTAIGTRGSVTVRMTINSRNAYINDRVSVLDVPAQLINNSTYVPLRFPAEAFGATVKWEESTQTATILLPEEAEPGTGTPPVPQPGSATGVVSAVDAGRVVLVVNGALQTYPVVTGTIIMRQGQQVAATALQPGDQAQVDYDEQGNAKLVKATFETVEGKVVAKVPNQILLDTKPAPFVIQPQAVVTVFGTNAAAQFADLKNGDSVVLQVTPGTNLVNAIAIKPAAGTPPTPLPTGKPVIDRFYTDATRPLGAGQIMHVTLEGTAAGTAFFDIGTVRQGIQLPESKTQPGRYEASFVVPPRLNILGVPLLGHLQVGTQAADSTQSVETVTLDSNPPAVRIFGPAANSQTSTLRPNLAMSITDPNGSGVDPGATTIVLTAQGTNVPLTIGRQGQLMTLNFSPLPPGAVNLVVDAYDKAGNRTHVDLPFTVAAATGTAQVVATHDAAGNVLLPGDLLTVSATGPPGGQVTFSLGQWRTNLPMTEVDDQPGTYRGQFTVPNLAADREETVTVRLQPAQGTALTAALTPTVQFGQQRPLAPVLSRPVAGAKVGETLVIEGTTRPLAEVVCTITWKGTILGILEQTGQVAQARLTADAQGRFVSDPISLKVESLVSARNVSYTLTCTATRGGQTSNAVKVTFTQ